ncbi:MAG: hypothetical protein Kow0069_12400 [Promethearchaeota archaeon]
MPGEKEGTPSDRKLQNVTINIPEAYCDAIERLIKAGLFSSRSEAIREAIKEFLEKERSFLVVLGLEDDERPDGEGGEVAQAIPGHADA